MEDVDALLSRTEERRSAVSATLDAKARARYGQFFTPRRAATLIAGLPRLPNRGTLRVLDPGAGSGALTAALVGRIIQERPSLKVAVQAVEVDPDLTRPLQATLEDCRRVAASHGVEVVIECVAEDFVDAATGLRRNGSSLTDAFDLVIMNPPYRKLAASSAERTALTAEGVDCPNLYSAFLALGAFALVPNGQLVAITPRSFTNGPYFGRFRQFLLDRLALDRLHVFESRSTVFADSDVLQENVVFSATRRDAGQNVVISTSRGHIDAASSRRVPYAEIVRPDDRHQFIRLPVDEADTYVAEVIADLPCELHQLGLQVSTGKVVDFRARDHLRDVPEDGSAPLVYPGNLREGLVHWPLPLRKPQAISHNPNTSKLMLPCERFVVVKRFTSKEERRRVVAAVFDPEQVPAAAVGFENHLNVFHTGEHGLGREIARGLCLWLNSSVVDIYFRTFSGHTQVNATDLRSLRYPSPAQLESLGDALGEAWPDQDKIDDLVANHVLVSRLLP